MVILPKLTTVDGSPPQYKNGPMSPCFDRHSSLTLSTHNYTIAISTHRDNNESERTKTYSTLHSAQRLNFPHRTIAPELLPKHHISRQEILLPRVEYRSQPLCHLRPSARRNDRGIARGVREEVTLQREE